MQPAKKLLPVRSPWQGLLVGALWGWLPCGMVYTASLSALASGGAPNKGALTMLAFGLGTLPICWRWAPLPETLRSLSRQAAGALDLRRADLRAGPVAAGAGVVSRARYNRAFACDLRSRCADSSAVRPDCRLAGPLAVRWYGLMYLLGFVLFMLLGQRRLAQSRGVFTAKMLDDLLFYGVLGVILGGRLGYVLFYKLGDYLADPLAILRVWEGGMAFHGGFLA